MDIKKGRRREKGPQDVLKVRKECIDFKFEKKFKIDAFNKKLQKSVIFDIFGVFGLKTTSDHKSEVIKVAFKFDFTSENNFLNLKSSHFSGS